MRVSKVANRTIDTNKNRLARARSSALSGDEAAEMDADQPEREPRAAEADTFTDQDDPSLAVASGEAEDEVDEDLRVSGGALATRPSTRPSARGVGVPAPLMANSFTRFLAESYIELRKVTWPDSREAWTLTLVVIGMSLLVAVILGAADFGLNHFVSWFVSL
jgi:preprotein translocase SecE subunit